mgnify:CR=1 FL=1
MATPARLLLLPLFTLLMGCQSSSPPDEGDRLTTGVVQREIRKGMSSAAVAEALGSPNIVATDEDGREVWVYERFAREVKSTDNNYWVVFVWGGQREATTRQRTLTVIVKFDDKGLVRDFAYHSTSF